MRAIVKNKYLIFILIFGTAIPALAEELCSGTTSNVETSDCLTKVQTKTDNALNKTYQSFLKTLENMEKMHDMPKGMAC